MPSRYRLLGRIEAGELAELHAAEGEQQEVVIRLFHPRTTDAAYAREIADVARVLRSVPDEGIVGYLDVGMVHGRLAVVRPRVEGFSLGEALPRLIGRELLLPAPLALTLVVQLLETLELAHRAGAVHGAITPGNVLVLSQGRLALQDFGALRALQAAPALEKEFAGRGRDAYRAPELARGEPFTIQSDIYSVGVIAYELLTFRQPPSGGFSTRREAVLPPSRIDRRLNVRIDPIIMRAIDPAPQRRFHSCADFAAGLRSFLANTGGMPLKEDLVRFAAEAMPKSPPPLGPPAFTEPFTLVPVGDSAPSPASTEDLVVPSAVLVPMPARVNPGAMAFDDRTEAVLPEETLTTELDRQPGAMAFDDRTVETAAPDEVLTTVPGRQPEAMAFDDSTSEVMPPDEVLTTAPGRPNLGDGVSAPTTDPDSPKPEGAAPAIPGAGAEWVAPPGTLPRPRRHPPASQATPGIPPRRNTRLKLIEDFQGIAAPDPAPPAGPVRGELLEEQGLKTPRRESPPLPLPALSPPSTELNAARTDPQGTSAPPDDAPVSPGTVERVYGQTRQRRRMVLVAAGIAVIGAVSFVVGLRRSGQEGSPAGSPDGPSEAAGVQPPNEDPAYRTVDGAMKKYLQAHEEKGTAAPNPPVAPPASAGGSAGEAKAEDGYDLPPPKRVAGFLTVMSNVPANVFIDGFKVRKRTPLVRYPVQPGNRKIVLEAVSTLERRELTLTFRRGQMRRVDEKFQRVR